MRKLNLSTLKHLLTQRLISEGFVDNHRECEDIPQMTTLSEVHNCLVVNYGLNSRDAWEMIARSVVLEKDE